MGQTKIHIVCLIFMGLCNLCNGAYSTVRGEIYPYGATLAPCVLKLNATGTTGCQARNSNGIVYGVNSESDLDELINDVNLSGGIAGFVTVIPSSLMNDTILKKIGAEKKIVGAIVTYRNLPVIQNVNSDEEIKSWLDSAEYSAFPLSEYSEASDLDGWNPDGRGIISQRYNLAILGVSPDDNSTMISLANAIANNKQKQYKRFPLMGVELKTFMWASTNSEVCLRKSETQPRSFCNPIGGQSIISTFSTENEIGSMQKEGEPDDSGKPILFVSAQLDSQTFFSSLSVGATSYLSGTLALVGAIDGLSSVGNISSLPSHIVFGFFDAQTWGLSGSRRFLEDLNSFKCTALNSAKDACLAPYRRDFDFRRFRRSKINRVIDVRQVSNGSLSSIGSLDLNNITNLNPNPESWPPFSSIPSFEEHLGSSVEYASVSDSEENVGNNYFFSPYDSELTLDQLDNICEAAESLAHAIYFEAAKTESDPNPTIPSLASNCNLINELYECLARNSTCDLTKIYLDLEFVNSTARDVSVAGQGPYSTVGTALLTELVANLTKTSVTDEECSFDKDCEGSQLCNANICITSFTRQHPSYGTGIEFDPSKNRYVVTNSSKPTWTISSFGSVGIRLYAAEDYSIQLAQLFGGIASTLISIYVSRKAVSSITFNVAEYSE